MEASRSPLAMLICSCLRPSEAAMRARFSRSAVIWACIERIARAIRTEGGEAAVQLKVAEKAVEAYAKVAAESNTTLIVPSNMSEVSNLIGSAMQMVRTLKPGA